MRNTRPTKAELATFQGATVDDLVADPLRLLFVGINPGLWTAAVNAHFARPGNRFWPALHRAGITADSSTPATVSRGRRRASWPPLGIGITNIVPTASARADELTRDEVRAGAAALRGQGARRCARRSSPCSASPPTGRRSAVRRRIGRRPTSLGAPSCGCCRTPAGSTPTRRSTAWPPGTARPREAAGVPLHR